jgi:hypothetical protein
MRGRWAGKEGMRQQQWNDGTTGTSLTANVRGASHLVLGDTTPSLAPNASGGGPAYFLNDYRDPLPPPSLQMQAEGFHIIVNVIIYKKM